MKKHLKTEHFHILEHIKTALLAVLIVCMLVLMVVYTGGTGVYEKSIYDKNMGNSFEKLWSVQGAVDQTGLDGNNLLPEFIGYKQKATEQPLGSVGNQSAVSELYDIIKPCILELFGSDSVCRTLPLEEGIDRFVAAQTGDEFIYLRYHTPVLYQLIYAYAADRLTISETDMALGSDGVIGAYISDMVIIPDNDFAAHRFVAYATDSKGNYYEFRPVNHFVASEFYISRLVEGGSNVYTHPFEFMKMDGSGVLQPMIDAELETAVLAYEPAIAGDTQIKDLLLRLFGYNPDKLNFYDDDGVKVYVDYASEFRISDSAVSFITSDIFDSMNPRGIKIGSLLGYTSDETYSLFDKITAADNLIRSIKKISPALLGGDEVMLCLGDVYTDGFLLVIEYFLTYNSIKIDNTPALKVALTEDAVCQFELKTEVVYGTESSTYNPKPHYVVRKLYELGNVPSGQHPTSVRLYYGGKEAAWNVYLK